MALSKISLRELLERGAHFGHRASRWNPNSEQFIFEERDNIHIIDLAKTKKQLEKAAEKLKQIGGEGEELLMLGTKRQAAKFIRKLGDENKIAYMTERWVGGFLTNYEQVKKNIEKMNDMAKEEKEGGWEHLPKHEQVEKGRELAKLRRVYGGVGQLTRVPGAIYIVDTRREQTAVREAKRLGVVSLGIVDTNADPRDVDFPIPANDDAIGTIEYITRYLVKAYISGKSKAQSAKSKGK